MRSLDASSANALLDDLLGTAPKLDALKAHVLRHTGQIPLFVEEVARQLINRAVLDGDASRFAAKARGTRWRFLPPCRGSLLPESIVFRRRTNPFFSLHPLSGRKVHQRCSPP
jgi:hypothetical protein